MKLYTSPYTCALAPQIALEETGLAYTLEKVNLRSKLTASGVDFTTINPKGYVPALELSPGVVLTEVPALLQWIADAAPAAGLAPANGTLERARLHEWLGFIGAEVHKAFSPLFNPATAEADRAAIHQRIIGRATYIDGVLADRPYLLGDHYSVADAYLFVVLSWAGMVKLDLGALSHLAAWGARVAERPAVQRVMAPPPRA